MSVTLDIKEGSLKAAEITNGFTVPRRQLGRHLRALRNEAWKERLANHDRYYASGSSKLEDESDTDR